MLKGRRKNSDEKIHFTIEQKSAFDQIKTEIADSTFKYQLNVMEVMILTTDSSDSSIGAILSQRDVNSKRQAVGFFEKHPQSTDELLYHRQKSSSGSKID